MKNLQVVETIIVNNQSIEFKSDGVNVYTDSLTVAKVFNKRHDHVLRDIRVEIGELNIEVSHYYGLQGLKHKLYYLTKEQFTLLVMGYTGAKAKAWKIEYISAFNMFLKIQ